MQVMYRERQQGDGSRRPTALDLSAAVLLLASVVLHVIAMFPRYFGGGAGEGSVWSQPDQAALFAVLTAGWALALGLVLAGPARARLGAGVAGGVVVTELGFRLTDLGEVLRYGGASTSVGMWLMTAAWAVGAAGAIVAVIAVHRRARLDAGTAGWRRAPAPVPTLAMVLADPPQPPAPVTAWAPRPDRELAAQWGPRPEPGRATEWGPSAARAAGEPTPRVIAPASSPGWAPPPPPPPVPALAAGVTPAGVSTNLPVPVEPTAPIRVEPTVAIPVDYPIGIAAGRGSDDAGRPARLGPYGVGPTLLVTVLTLVTAGAFLPAWDHYVGVVTSTGRSVSFSLGNAFTGPWPVVLGNVVAALALVAVPVAASRLKDRTIAAAVVVGSLIVLASQFTSAIVQVDQTVSPSVAGLTPAQANQLGLQLHLSLTGWFTLDVLAAYALFVAVMVIGYLRPVEAQANAAGAWPAAPEARQPVTLPWS